MSKFSTLARQAWTRTQGVRRQLATGVLFASVFTDRVLAAGLPKNPTGVESADKSFMVNMRDYIGMAFGLIALALAGFAFITVASGSITKFNEWRAGKAELGDLKAVFIVGGLLLIVVIWLVTQVVAVIASSNSFISS